MAKLVPPDGDKNSQYIILGESPREAEEIVGKGFIGKHSKLLWGILKSIGITREDCYVTNVFKYNPKGKKFKKSEIPVDDLKKEFSQLTGKKLVIAFGEWSLKFLFPQERRGILSVHGKMMFSSVVNCNVIPMVLPTYVYNNTRFYQAFVRGMRRVVIPLKELTTRWELIDTVEKANAAISIARNSEKRYIDTETAQDGKTYLIGMYLPEHNTTYIFTRSTMWMLLDILKSKGNIYHNAKYDLKKLFEYFGEWFDCSGDTMVKAHYIDETLKIENDPDTGYKLAILGEHFLGITNWKDLDYFQIGVNETPEFLNDLYTYLARDCQATCLLDECFDKLRDLSGTSYYTESIPLTNELARIEYYGIPFDEERAGQLMEHYNRKMDLYLVRLQKAFTPNYNPKRYEDIKKRIDKWKKQVRSLHNSQIRWLKKTEKEYISDGYKTVGFDLSIKDEEEERDLKITKLSKVLNLAKEKYNILYNPRSHPQNMKFFGKLLKRPVLSVDEEFCLEHIHLKEARWKYGYQKRAKRVDYLKNYKTNCKVGLNGQKYFFPSAYQNGTTTGRLSYKGPNMQNFTGALKQVVIPEPGHVLISRDYSQIEMRVIMLLAKCTKIVEGMKQGYDMHTITCAEMVGKTPEEVTAAKKRGEEWVGPLRRAAKEINFGTVYGLSMQRLAQLLNRSIPEAKEFKTRMFKPVEDFIKTVQDMSLKFRKVPSPSGRIRNFTPIDSAKDIKLQGFNFIPQNFAVHVCLMRLAEINRELMNRGWGRVLLNVHDEILSMVKKEVVKEADKLITEIMEREIDVTGTMYSFPTEGKVRERW